MRAASTTPRRLAAASTVIFTWDGECPSSSKIISVFVPGFSQHSCR